MDHEGSARRRRPNVWQMRMVAIEVGSPQDRMEITNIQGIDGVGETLPRRASTSSDRVCNSGPDMNQGVVVARRRSAIWPGKGGKSVK